ncbi:MAG TPA: hypothetical protein VGM92_07300 [Candidatus Kapabacteria bacterium]
MRERTKVFSSVTTNMARKDWIVVFSFLALELFLGYGIFFFYPAIAVTMFGAESALYTHPNEVARAVSPTLLLLFNIVVFISNMDTADATKLNRVNRSLGLLSGIYFGCYILFLICWATIGGIA